MARIVLCQELLAVARIILCQEVLGMARIVEAFLLKGATFRRKGSLARK